ncbi:MAG TPA: hypothetical protein EYM69_02050 [Dehalococcoidia bacterium]|nr:hypothetical protein [Dehalococcoidia bacterium]
MLGFILSFVEGAVVGQCPVEDGKEDAVVGWKAELRVHLSGLQPTIAASFADENIVGFHECVCEGSSVLT